MSMYRSWTELYVCALCISSTFQQYVAIWAVDWLGLVWPWVGGVVLYGCVLCVMRAVMWIVLLCVLLTMAVSIHAELVDGTGSE